LLVSVWQGTEAQFEKFINVIIYYIYNDINETCLSCQYKYKIVLSYTPEIITYHIKSLGNKKRTSHWLWLVLKEDNKMKKFINNYSKGIVFL